MTNVFGITARAFRWYNDDGSESASTERAVENGDCTVSPDTDTDIFLRYGVQESGSGSAAGAATDDYQLQYSLNGGAFTNVTGSSTVVQAHPSANLTDAAATTQRLSAGTGAFVAGEIDEADGIVTDWALTANNFSELLFSIRALAANLAEGDDVTFRVLRNGAVFNTYSVTPGFSAVGAVNGTATPSTVARTASVPSASGLGEGISSPATVAATATVHPVESLGLHDIYDLFNRSVTDGWGTSDSGDVWTVLGGADANFDVGGGVGTIVGAAGTGRTTHIGSGIANAEVLARVFYDILPSGAAGEFHMRGRLQDGSNSYRMVLTVPTTGNMQIRWQRQTTGGTTVIGSILTTDISRNEIQSPGVYVKIYYEDDGAGGINLKAKVWDMGSGEPAYTDANKAIERNDAVASWASGSLGIATFVGAGGSTITYNLEHIDLRELAAAGADGTATPSTVAASASIPSATGVGEGIALPSAVARTASVPAATGAGNGIASPGAVARTASVPQATGIGNGIALPSAVGRTASVPSATGAGDGIAQPATVARTASVPQATANVGGVDGVAQPSTVARTTTVPSATGVGTGVGQPSAVQRTASVPAATGAGTGVASPPVVARAASVPASSGIVEGAGVAQPSTVSRTASVPAATGVGNGIVRPTQNLLTESQSSLETGSGWTQTGSPGWVDTGRVFVGGGVAFHGGWVHRQTEQAAGGAPAGNQRGIRTNPPVSGVVSAEPGEVFTMSMYVRTLDRDDADFRMQAVYQDASFTGLVTHNSPSYVVDIADGWQRFTFTLPAAPANAAWLDARFLILGSATPSARYDFDAIQVDLGPTATAFNLGSGIQSVARTASVPIATGVGNGVAQPSVVARTAAVPNSVGQGAGAATPVSVSRSAAVPAATGAGSAIAMPAAVAASATRPIVVVVTNGIAMPGTVAAVATIPAVVASGGAVASAATYAALASVPQATAAAGAAVAFEGPAIATMISITPLVKIRSATPIAEVEEIVTDVEVVPIA